MKEYLDFAECPSGHSTPIRPSTLHPLEDDQEWSDEDAQPVVVACSECKRVYSFETQRLKALATDYGLSPDNPEAPMHAFRVQLWCGTQGCETPLKVFAVRKRDTTDEELQREKADWTWENLTCPSGHPIPNSQAR
jgi:hypothetical protein